MNESNCDARPRLYVNANRDGKTVTHSTHPSARGQFALSIDAAMHDAGLAETAAVIFWSPKPPPT